MSALYRARRQSPIKVTVKTGAAIASIARPYRGVRLEMNHAPQSSSAYRRSQVNDADGLRSRKTKGKRTRYIGPMKSPLLPPLIVMNQGWRMVLQAVSSDENSARQS